MILALVCIMKLVHLIAQGVYEVFGVFGCIAAFAAIYRVAVLIDRSETEALD